MIRALLLLTALAPLAAAQGAARLDRGAWTLGAAPTAKVGTHETSLGLAAVAARPLARPVGATLSGMATVGAEALVVDLGLPGASVGAQVGLALGVGFGTEREAQSIALDGRRLRVHEVAYRLLAYLDTDGTSQLSGALAYRYTGPGHVVEVWFENDALAQRLRDEYRTAAVRVRVLRTSGAVPVGVGVRAVLWTGTTAGLGRLTRDEAYDLSGQRGGRDPHGILALDLHHGGLTLSLGADAEGIRSALQNTYHRLIDDGRIPVLEGRRPRLVIRIALNETGGLY